MEEKDTIFCVWIFFFFALAKGSVAQRKGKASVQAARSTSQSSPFTEKSLTQTFHNLRW